MITICQIGSVIIAVPTWLLYIIVGVIGIPFLVCGYIFIRVLLRMRKNPTLWR